MPDAFMPDVVVEIAFTSGYTTPAASRTWTDVSQYVELADRLQIAFGRQDELSTAGANTLNLTLDNTDGRFTAGRSASPYYPNVKIGRPIRVTVTPPGGTASTRFVGFIDEWPVEWDGTDRYAMAKIKAASRLSRLGLSAKLLSPIEQEIHAASPLAYYTLGDPAGTTSPADSSGENLAGQFIKEDFSSSFGFGSADFGNSIGVASDSLTAMHFPVDNGDLWYAPLPSLTVRSLRVTFLASAGDSSNFLPVSLARSGTGLPSMILGHYGASDAIPYGVYGGVFGSGLEGGTASAGQLHDLVVTSSVADGAKLYLDGVLVDTGAGTDYTGMTRISLGSLGNLRELTMCHVAIYDVILTPTQIVNQATAALSGFAGDRTDERVVRLLGWAGVTATEVTAQTGVETMTYQATRGMAVVDALRECESTEGGVLFDGRDGNVTFHNRSNRYLKTPAATLNMAAQHVGADYAPKLDRSTLLNDVTVGNPTTEQSARAVDSASRDEYGVATGSATSVASSYWALQEKAGWLIASYAEPRNRVPSLTVDVLAHQGLTPSAQTLLGLTVGDLLAVSNAPAQADATSASYFIEGYSESIGPESYEITFNLSPTHPSLNTFVLEDATRGQLDSTYVLAL